MSNYIRTTNGDIPLKVVRNTVSGCPASLCSYMSPTSVPPLDRVRQGAGAK
jgi:hypothetical protein